MKKAMIVVGCTVWVLIVIVVAVAIMTTLSDRGKARKPVLYVYPQVEQRLTVTLDLEGTLDTVYPAPDSVRAADGRTQASWTLDAAPNGTLTGLSRRTYPSLFWDGRMVVPDPEQGFVVSRDDAVPFLEDKLSQLGLNDREAADFITYWAPRMRAHEYTFVSFDATAYTQRVSYRFADEADNEITPDSFIRVFMTIREADATTVAQPQTFAAPPVRTGFTAVEWGGAEW